jgi:hypothetical protein
MGGGLYHLPFSSLPRASDTVSSVCLLDVRPARCGEFIRADVPLGRCTLVAWVECLRSTNSLNCGVRANDMSGCDDNGAVASQIETDQRMPSVAR